MMRSENWGLRGGMKELVERERENRTVRSVILLDIVGSINYLVSRKQFLYYFHFLSCKFVGESTAICFLYSLL